jgi:hypothetical protein
MAKDEEQPNQGSARLPEKYEAWVPRRDDLVEAVVAALDNNGALPQEVLIVCLHIMLLAYGDMFGDAQANILDQAIGQVLMQSNGDGPPNELFGQSRSQWEN